MLGQHLLQGLQGDERELGDDLPGGAHERQERRDPGHRVRPGGAGVHAAGGCRDGDGTL